MKQSVYLETSVVSYYTSRPSRDLVIAARQQETHEWWQEHIPRYEVYVSELVLREASDGDTEAAKQRITAVEGFQVLNLNEDVYALARVLLDGGAIPTQYPEDSLHIAVAAVHGMDYLLTWNFRHINNANRRAAIERTVRGFGNECPVICSPAELIGE